MIPSTLAQIKFEGFNLLLPQDHVASIERINLVDTEHIPPGSVGVLRLDQLEWPVYALSKNFTAHANCPQYFTYCVAFNHAARPTFAIACEEVTTIMVDSESLAPLQVCMRSNNNPICSLLLRDDTLMLVSEVEVMQNYLTMEIAA